MKKFIFPIILLIVVFSFFYQTFITGLLPIPSDTIIGLYHPFRDLYLKDYPNGIPYKNYLITDPVRQIYPWKNIAAESLKSGQIPLWNPYEMAGTPLLANFQSSSFYLLNILLFIFPFSTGWSLMIILQPALAGLFLYLYLRNQKLRPISSIFGAITFAFCGFSVAWLEWNTVIQTILWLPLVLLSIDKIFAYRKEKLRQKNKTFVWSLIFTVALTSSFFAGHLQTFLYIYIIVMCYFLSRWLKKKNVKMLFFFISLNLLFFIITFIQWGPTLQFISLSARNIDQSYTQPGWFIPWQNLVQFFVPDFFGNPTTLNYWGVWNYAEFVGYIGITPLLFVIFAWVGRKDKTVALWSLGIFISLLLATPNKIAELPFILHIPFISTSQPTRLLFVTCFCLSILSAYGFESFLLSLSEKKIIIRKIILACGIIGIIFASLWIVLLFGAKHVNSLSIENLVVSKRNLIFQTILLVLSGLALLLTSKLKNHAFQVVAFSILIIISVFDLFRFGQKFETFSKKEYLFPQTKTIEFLQKNLGAYRIASTDSRIFPPNFPAEYRLQSIEGYDPLYLLSYGELIAASERGKPNISPPFGFNRIITPHNMNSPIIKLLGVKYVLSLSEISSPQFKKVFQEGQTLVYENKEVLPRAFFVKNITCVNTKDQAINQLFKQDLRISATIFMEENCATLGLMNEFSIGNASIIQQDQNRVIIQTLNSQKGFLVLTDNYYPSWSIKVDGATKKIYKTDFTFRGVFVPAGKHEIIFSDSLL